MQLVAYSVMMKLTSGYCVVPVIVCCISKCCSYFSFVSGFMLCIIVSAI